MYGDGNNNGQTSMVAVWRMRRSINSVERRVCRRMFPSERLLMVDCLERSMTSDGVAVRAPSWVTQEDG